MDHRHALWLVGPILLGLAARLLTLAADGRPDPGPPPAPCARWVQVGAPSAPLICLDRRPASCLRRAGVSAACLRRFPPQALRAGDRLHRPAEASCQRRRMPAGLIATLGLPVDVNRAGAAELATLPGIGPMLARRLLAHRRRHGPFRRPEDLRAVRGIGPRLLARLRPRLARCSE
jgi:competence ComEA-like helix-hairpin-helix protein